MMGFIKNIIKLPFKGIKKAGQTVGGLINGSKESDSPIIAVVETENPNAYDYFFESFGTPTTRFMGYTIVWKKGTKEDEKKKTMEELKKLI
jgi:hypothetical protein